MHRKKLTKKKQQTKGCRIVEQLEEITTILHAQNKIVSDMDIDSQEELGLINIQAKNISNLSDTVDALLKDTQTEVKYTNVPSSNFQQGPSVNEVNIGNWNELVEQYAPSSIETLTLDSLLSSDQISQINFRFQAPIKRNPWKIPHDYTAVFSAAVIGIIADIFCAPINNPLAKYLENLGMSSPENHNSHVVYKSFDAMQKRIQASGIGDKFPWLQKIASLDVSHNNLPIDYKGSHFGGAHHRNLSGGHDLLRFLAAIWQIKNGQFIGIRYEYGKPVLEIIGSQAKKGGASYPTNDWTTSIILYGLHIAADFFTSTSLPVPGATLLREMPSRQIRTIVHDAYKGGYNMRHLVGQSVTPLVTSLIIHIYYILMYRIPSLCNSRTKKDDVQGETIKGLKLNEMLVAAHTMVAGVNTGRIAITGDWFSLNFPQLLTTISQLYLLGMKTWRRYDIFARVDRNRLLLEDGWTNLEKYCQNTLNPNVIEWPNGSFIID